METVLESPTISKNSRNNQFAGLHGEFVVRSQSIVECRSSSQARNFHLLCLQGAILPNQKLGLLRMQLKITESKENGPLYVNRGRTDFFIYNNGAVRKLMDGLKINLTSELVGAKLKVFNNEKGFWVIDINSLSQYGS